MMNVFIVRPFGTKSGIDFDRIETDLIRPAMEQAGLTGGTTGQFIQQGNIRTDMFEQLLTADLVIADISIHNANVFYELGIRHALRDKRTFLIKSKGDKTTQSHRYRSAVRLENGSLLRLRPERSRRRGGDFRCCAQANSGFTKCRQPGLSVVARIKAGGSEYSPGCPAGFS